MDNIQLELCGIDMVDNYLLSFGGLSLSLLCTTGNLFLTLATVNEHLVNIIHVLLIILSWISD